MLTGVVVVSLQVLMVQDFQAGDDWLPGVILRFLSWFIVIFDRPGAGRKWRRHVDHVKAGEDCSEDTRSPGEVETDEYPFPMSESNCAGPILFSSDGLELMMSRALSRKTSSSSF